MRFCVSCCVSFKSPPPVKAAFLFEGGKDQALPAAEGEAGGNSAGGTGCTL